MEQKKRIIGIDPGSGMTGVAVLDNSTIVGAFNASYTELWAKITHFLIYPNISVVVEDIKPYSLKLSQQVIDTCKLIGEIKYRLQIECGYNVEFAPRSSVKKWAFDTFPDVVLPLVSAKMDKKLFPACNVITRELVSVDNNGRGKRKESFVSVDDSILTKCMAHLYKIPTPKPGKGYDYGLKEHSWQALALASYHSFTLG